MCQGQPTLHKVVVATNDINQLSDNDLVLVLIVTIKRTNIKQMKAFKSIVVVMLYYVRGK